MALSALQRRTADAIVNVFETGTACGGYERIAVLPGDTGHLSYGRMQASLGSGNLHLLIETYCNARGAQLAVDLGRWLPRLAARDPRLDEQPLLRGLLHVASSDPVMRATQDAFVERVLLDPALRRAQLLGLDSALALAVVHDGAVHGSFARLVRLTAERRGTPQQLGERAWITAYVATRRDWLAGHRRPDLRRTVRRMDAFTALIDEERWALPLPLSVLGVRIDRATLGGAPPAAEGNALARSERVLRTGRPRPEGPDVRELQRALRAAGFDAPANGRFDDATERAVRAFQRSRHLAIDGIVGPATRAALGR